MEILIIPAQGKTKGSGPEGRNLMAGNGANFAIFVVLPFNVERVVKRGNISL